MAAISPVVQVVTGGTDWPAIVAAISTGVVGLAGIGGTLWQGKRAREAQAEDLRTSLEATATNLNLGITAEDTRARLAQKRQMYADCLTAFAEMMSALVTHRAEYSADDQDKVSMQAAMDQVIKARVSMFGAVSILQLGAPQDVSLLATQLQEAMTSFSDDTINGARLGTGTQEISKVRPQLYRAMRMDLGEPVESHL